MYHKVRRKMQTTVASAIVILSLSTFVIGKSIDIRNHEDSTQLDDNFENNIIDFDEEYSLKLNKKYDVPWHDKDSLKYQMLKKDEQGIKSLDAIEINENNTNKYSHNQKVEETTKSEDSSTPFELISTSENPRTKLWDSTTEEDLTVIPLSTTVKPLNVKINQTVTLPASTQSTQITEVTEITTLSSENDVTTEFIIETTISETTSHENYMKAETTTENFDISKELNSSNEIRLPSSTTNINSETTTTIVDINKNETDDKNKTSMKPRDLVGKQDQDSTEEIKVPIFTELDTVDYSEVPEDYYDSKDVMPTPAPKTDALSVLFGFAGSVVESVAEKVVPKGIYDLFKRMQRQNEALEAERLRSREENGGLGQFGRGILKSISTGLSKPFIQIMDGVRDRGSLDSDRGFVSSLASGVTTVANAASSAVEQFKDRVQAIYPGTLWCGGGHSASARSGELGFFFLTDTCCRQHDACKIFIKSGDTKYGLTNTGLFTRSHCSCDAAFRDCLRRTNSLVSSQIGLTYFNVLGPQCLRKAHPIVKCVRRTRITGQKCEEYELDYTKPKMWQWFDNEFF